MNAPAWKVSCMRRLRISRSAGFPSGRRDRRIRDRMAVRSVRGAAWKKSYQARARDRALRADRVSAQRVNLGHAHSRACEALSGRNRDRLSEQADDTERLVARKPGRSWQSARRPAGGKRRPARAEIIRRADRFENGRWTRARGTVRPLTKRPAPARRSWCKDLRSAQIDTCRDRRGRFSDTPAIATETAAAARPKANSSRFRIASGRNMS